MTLDPLTGHVVVLAAPGTRADADVRGLAVTTGGALLACGMLVATVTNDVGVIDDLERAAASQLLDPPLSWRADPGDRSIWDRLYPQIEQRLGPVDAVVVDPEALDTVEAAFRTDMLRRGHGAIVVLSPGDDPVDAIRRQLHRMR